MSMPAPIARPKGKAITFVGLPLETQQQIVRYMDRRELFVFQRLSPYCLSLASAEIYRNLDLTLINPGEDETVSSSSHAAEVLHTILASEHDYGKHVKKFQLGVYDDVAATLGCSHNRSDPLMMTRLLWDSSSDSSKFLNTALLLMIRKASIMESFIWDLPIEIGGAVYRALHKITSLKHLQVRLDVSASPRWTIRSGHSHNHHPTNGQQSLPTLPSMPFNMPSFPPLPATSSAGSHLHSIQAGGKPNVKRKKGGMNDGYGYWANPRTFSGFKHLTTLAIMRITNLDCLLEVAGCIKSSSATLKSLTLTLSNDLAQKAQKPPPVNPELDDPSETELEDDEIFNDPTGGPTTQSAPPANEADIRKEQVAQEGILARVFDLQGVAAEGKRIEKKLSLSNTGVLPESDSESISRKVNTLMKAVMEAPTPSETDRLEHFKTIREVADLYISSQNLQNKYSKEQIKSPLPPVSKKCLLSSKPLNPLASDFKGTDMSTGHTGSSWSPETDTSGFTALLMDPELQAQVGYEESLYSSKSPLSGWNPSGQPPYANHNTLNANPGGLLTQGKALVPPSSSSNAPLSAYQSAYAKSANLQKQAAYAKKLAYNSPYGLASPANAPPPMVVTPPKHWNGQVEHLVTKHGSPKQDLQGLADWQASYSHSPLGSSTNGNPSPAVPDATGVSVQTGSKKAKGKSQPPKKSSPTKIVVPPESDGENDTPIETPQSATRPFFAAIPVSENAEDIMDVDMEHPDDSQEELEDQEILPEKDEPDIPTPRKRARFEAVEAESAMPAKGGPSSEAPKAPVVVHEMHADGKMQAYIRATHGLQLESFSLEWVPLRPSIVARALDLSVLKRLTLLQVGPQDAFWTLLTRLQCATPEISLKSIHTDNVSLAFVKFLATFEGLEELFMHERGSKQVDAAGTQILIQQIRKLALRKHAATLRRLMLRNERDDGWDVDTKTLQFLAVKASHLRELCISLNMKTYHVLMCSFAAFKNLYALQFVSLRSGDRGMALQNESLNFAVDSLSHCQDMKIKYLAIQATVIMLESKPEQTKKQWMPNSKKAKGKGKAPVLFNDILEQYEEDVSDDIEVALAGMLAGESKVRRSVGIEHVKDVKIFSRSIRTGKL